MFSEHLRLTVLMLATQQIQNDTSLTQAEKEQALQDLQTNYQDRVQERGSNEPNL